LPPLDPIDLSFVCSDEFQVDCQKKHQDTLCYLGMKTAKFLNAYDQFELAAIKEAFNSISDTNKNLTSEESNALSQIFWNHYFTKPARIEN